MCNTMLMLYLWWSALCISYIALICWLEYNGALERAYDARCGRKDVDVERDQIKDAPVVYKRRAAALTGVTAFIISCLLLIAHFVTPRLPLHVGIFNTTL